MKYPCTLGIKLAFKYSSFRDDNWPDIASNWRIYRQVLLSGLLCCLPADQRHAKCWGCSGCWCAPSKPCTDVYVFMFSGCTDTKFDLPGSLKSTLKKQDGFTQLVCDHYYCTEWFQSQTRAGLGESSSWTYLLSGQTTRKKPNLKLQEEKVSYKNSSATNQGVCLHVLTFLGSQERGLSLCLWPGDWQTLRPCQVCLGLDVLAGKLELLSETIIQFLSLVQLMAFI